MLLVLDDARDADQVRPLLPGTAGSAVLVTSRHDLTGLAALQGGRCFPVSVLGPEAGRTLLALGTAAVQAAPAAASELVELCGHLPLAIRIAAANVARRNVTIADHVAELRAGDRLGKLAVAGDPHAVVRPAFDLSYAHLDHAAQRMFRLLGLIPGPDFTVDAAAALLDGTADQAGLLIDRLAAANLVQHHAPRRWRFHDLIRLYAAELAESERVAWSRLCHWYLSTAEAVVRFDYDSPLKAAAETGTSGRPVR